MLLDLSRYDGIPAAMTTYMNTYKRYLVWMTAIVMVLSSVMFAVAITDAAQVGYDLPKSVIIEHIATVHLISDLFVWGVLAVVGLVVVALINSLKTTKG